MLKQSLNVGVQSVTERFNNILKQLLTSALIDVSTSPGLFEGSCDIDTRCIKQVKANQENVPHFLPNATIAHHTSALMTSLRPK